MHDSSLSTESNQAQKPTSQHERTAAEWAVQTFDIGQWELDVATWTMDLSPRAALLVGVAPGRIACDALLPLVHAHDRAMLFAAINRATDPMGTGQVRMDVRVVDAAGRTTWLDCRAQVLYEHRDGKRQAVSLRGAMLDLTERKRIEEHARRSEEHLRVATEAALFYAWEINLATYKYRGAHNTRSIIGFTLPSDITDVWQIIHPDDRTVFQAAIQAAVETFTTLSVEFRFIHPETGASVWVSSSGRALPGNDDLPPRIVGVTQNITQRKEAELALRQSEERYRTLFTSIDEGFYIIEKLQTPPGQPSDYRFVEANPAFEHFAEIGGLAGKTVRTMFPNGPESWYNAYDHVIKHGEPILVSNNYTYKHRVLMINAFRIEDDTHRRVGVQVVDITDRYRAEQVREAALATTEQARAAAVAAIGTRDQFVNIASHELRTPLTSLLGYARMLETGMIANRLPDIATLIVRQAQRLDTLVGQMLDTSRLERGQFAVDPTLLDLDTLILRVVEEFRLTMSTSARHRLTLHPAYRPLMVMADAERMTQVFENLLTNAVKYSPHSSPLDVQVYWTVADAVVEVTDYGIGISPDAQSHIFEAFYRADNAGTIANGFGLGLHVAQAIVSHHGGRIEIESTIGEGSTFRVLIPRLLEDVVG